MELLKGKKILVTGGAGFIGSHLCESLLSKGNKIICLDNFATGKKENIQHLLGNSGFQLIEGDIRDLETCRRSCQEVDLVSHQAALGSVPRSIQDPMSTHEVNITGFLNMLIAAKDAGIQRFVYAASSSTYGDSKELPKVEDHIGKPLSPYAITKYVNELYAEIFHNTYGLEFVGLRYFNVFGPKQDPNGDYAAVIPKFIQALIQHESPVINGDGTHSRDFTYIDNVVQINQLALTNKDPEALNQVYNVAFGESHTLSELVDSLKKYLHEFDSEIGAIEAKHGPNRAGDIPHSLASIEKAKSLLDYNPAFNFQEGLKETVKWFWERS